MKLRLNIPTILGNFIPGLSLDISPDSGEEETGTDDEVAGEGSEFSELLKAPMGLGQIFAPPRQEYREGSKYHPRARKSSQEGVRDRNRTHDDIRASAVNRRTDIPAELAGQYHKLAQIMFQVYISEVT